MARVPDVATVTAYLAEDGSVYTDAKVQRAYDTERANQASVCTVPASDAFGWEPDLSEALMRRVARNLATGALPLGTTDPVALEIKRLEAPYRRYPVG